MRVAVVDDEQMEREKLTGYLRDFEKETNTRLDVDIFVSGDELLKQYKRIYDIIIFDVDMPGTNGMDTARRIRTIDKHVVILFVTNMAQYTINGYEVDAVDYIIKPVGYYDFLMKFRRTVAKAAQSQDSSIYLETTEGVRKLRVADIVYVEVMLHYLVYHAGEKQHKVRGSMREHEQELTTYQFCRIHKSYLANLTEMDEIRHSEVRMKNGETLPVGRSYKNQLLQAYMKYVRGQ